MSVVISCQNVSKTFGAKPLFENINITIDSSDRVGVIGPNGSGKSTLLKIMCGLMQPDEGTVAIRKNLRLAYVAQQSDFKNHKTIRDALEENLTVEDYEKDALINNVLGKCGFLDDAIDIKSLSGGWKKRLQIACALVQDPEVLLMDEPTNHLDVEGILWLEKFLARAPFAYVVISHDRYFLENAAQRTVEINKQFPEGIFSADGAYSEFLAKKADFIEAQKQQHLSLANKVRREVEWLRQGAKARTTKQQARIQNALELQEQLSGFKERSATSKIDIEFQSSNRKTKKLVSLVDVSKALGGKQLMKNLDLILSPGVRLGLLGLNGSGKTTLLKMISREVVPDSGKVDYADGLKMIYFDQNREKLDPNVTLKRTLAPDSDSVVTSGRAIHVASWARQFLFQADQLEVPVGKLSGGEQARALIAKLMSQPADVLLLDEPTNDLDIPTLEVLEDSLMEFPGAVVLVTHDRYLLDRVSNVLLALDGHGKVNYFADFYQWQQTQVGKPISRHGEKVEVVKAAPSTKKKLSYNEQRELDHMEENILKAEELVSEYQKQSEDPKIASSHMKLQEVFEQLKSAQDKVEKLYARWAELQDR